VDFEELFYKLDTQLINKKNSLYKIAEVTDKDSRVEVYPVIGPPGID